MCRMKQIMPPKYEASIGAEIAYALRNGKSIDEIEVDGIFFTFDVKTQPDETETAYTGVTFMGDCESYTCTTHRARIKYTGAYKLCHAPSWDPYGDTRDVEIDLDMGLLAKCIEEQDDDCDKYIISIAA